MSRIKVVLGALQLEYEGDQDFIENRLIAYISEVSKLAVHQSAHAVATPHSNDSPQNNEGAVSTNTIAQAISAKTGADLVLAAMARILIGKGRPSASRQEILDEMKEATTYYRDSYASNLSAYLDTLVRNKRANLVSRGFYALTAGERDNLYAAVRGGA